jgi:hypothetical protein
VTDLTNWAPYNILVGPADVYVAATATAFPKVTEVPTEFTYVGQTDGGVNVKHNQTVNPITTDQHTGAVKAVRTDESLEVSFSIVELTLENYSLALNGNAVTTTSGPNVKTLFFHRGVHVALKTLLIRGRSPYGNFPAQYQIPVCYQQDSPDVSFIKTDKSVLACTWNVLEDLSASTDEERFGRLVAQTS